MMLTLFDLILKIMDVELSDVAMGLPIATSLLTVIGLLDDSP